VTTTEESLDWMISVDDHVIEPPGVWQDRVPARYSGVAPRMVEEGDDEYWVYENRRVATSGLSATAGKQTREFSPEPIRYRDMRAGCYDSKARLEDMNQAGILASMCFPSFPRFCGQIFWEARDKELALLCVRAYNDWMIDEWCGSAPGRYVPCIIIPHWDPRLAAAEIERCAGKGARALTFSENPSHLGLPSLFDTDRYWDPVLSAAADAHVVICTHVGSSSLVPEITPDTPQAVNMAWMIGVRTSGALLMWLFSGVFERFPALRLALSEGGIGWIPWFVQRAQQVADKQHAWASDTSYKLTHGDRHSHSAGTRKFQLKLEGVDFRQMLREHVYGCFIDDEVGADIAIKYLGAGNVMAESDYPHSDSSWPDSIGLMRRQLAHLSVDDQVKILRGNAERLFEFTPAPFPSTDA
jgi:predicted TIM-barrel fold metal-dependent hydrolase